MKPVELVEQAIRNNSKSRDTILDPFAGSGTTVIACEKTGRQGRVIDIPFTAEQSHRNTLGPARLG